jgi:DNA-directed RNA polymerase specialized sigma subunit
VFTSTGDVESTGDDASHEAAVTRAIDMVRLLRPRELEIAILYHGMGLQMKEIGLQFGITESRVCYIMGEIRTKLQARGA